MIHFRKAITSEAKPLVGLYSESGAGKTRSSLMIGHGFNDGDMSLVGMIETESGRGEAYASDPILGGYNVLPIRQEFSPKAYGAAIKAAEDAKFRTLIIDSASHEWEGVSGVLSMAAEAQAEGKKGPLVWQNAKIQHAREFMLRLTQTSIPLVIVCMRAKFTMEEVVVNGKKEWQRSKFLSPKQSEDILYEMFIHGYIDQAHKFHGTKYTLDVLKKVFLDGEMITVETGQRLAAWAKGGAAPLSPVPLTPMVTRNDFAGHPPPINTQPRSDEPDIHSMIMTATNFDTLNEAIDLIRSVKDEHLRAELDVASRRRAKELRAKA